MKIASQALIVLFLAVISPLANAVPVQWVVDQGTTFFDGTSLSGSFVYDSATDMYSSVQLSTQNGTMVTCLVPGAPGVCDVFDAPTPVLGSTVDGAVTAMGGPPEPNLFGFLLADIADDGELDRGLFLNFLGVDLVSGTVAMDILDWFCVAGDCTFDIQSSRFRSGSGSVSAVPEPGTLGLLGAGLIGLAWRRRRA